MAPSSLTEAGETAIDTDGGGETVSVKFSSSKYTPGPVLESVTRRVTG